MLVSFGHMNGSDPTVDNLAECFTSQVMNAIDFYFPLKQVKFHGTDKPWVTPYFVKNWQKASGNIQQ
jgi:hypothetical protein